MDLFTLDEIKSIVKCFGNFQVRCWRVEPLSGTLIGYLGDHLKLLINVEGEKELNLFIKCIPLNDIWKADYIRRLGFFKKEYVMLSQVFKEFGGDEGPRKWRPKLLFIKEEIFVFENLTELGYKMPHNLKTLAYPELLAVVKSLATFHARSYVCEEKKCVNGKKYSIWNDFSEYLQEPLSGQNWRNAGRNAVIELIKVFSKYKDMPNFNENVDKIVSDLYEQSLILMKPHKDIRNVIIHRDLWSNNIFLKTTENDNIHAILIDYQTVLYSSPMLDLSSILFFNTTRHFRDKYFNNIFDLYFQVLSEELHLEGLDVNTIVSKEELLKNYDKSLVFGLTQAGIIVPIIALEDSDKEAIFCNLEISHRVNEVSRSAEFLAVAYSNLRYRNRVMDILDEIVDRFICSDAFQSII